MSLSILQKMFKKKTEIQYVVKDSMLEKQNKIINSLIRISFENTDIKKSAENMICIIREQYIIKNCSLFIGSSNKLEYLGTDIDEEYREDVKIYINSIETDNDAVIIESAEGKYLSYSSAERRKIVYSVFIYLKKMNEILGALYIELDTKKDAEIFEQEMFKTVMESITLAVENLVLRMELIEQSKRDQLTKLYNRNYLEEYIETLEDKKYSLAMIDVDFFKRINDKYGHKAGDDVLKYVSSVLNKLQEYYCEVFRIGGEEFLIIAQMSKETLAGFLEDIRREIEHKELIILDKVIKVTISTGITDSYDGKNFEDVQKKADQELYKVKSSGRNQVSTYVE